jgi:hypothetical protein
MRARRVLDLKAGRGAKALDAFLSKRSRGRVKALRTYALVNQEQAAAALRMTVIANATIPIAFVTVLTQISDGQIWASATLWDGVRDLYVEDPVFFGFLAAVCLLSFFVLFWLLAYSATRMGQARDVRHCIDLHVAERGVFFGLEDEAELP